MLVRVSQESQDTGGGVRCVHTMTDRPYVQESQDTCPSQDDPISEYPRNPRILRQGGGGDDILGIPRVSQESQDTQKGGGGG